MATHPPRVWDLTEVGSPGHAHVFGAEIVRPIVAEVPHRAYSDMDGHRLSGGDLKSGSAGAPAGSARCRPRKVRAHADDVASSTSCKKNMPYRSGRTYTWAR